MEENRNFIKGGLPLNSGDFVDKSKAKENKSKLLAALDNINKIHEKKMTTENAAKTSVQNIDAVGITLDMLDKENIDAVKNTKDEYILDSQIVRDPAPTTQQETTSAPIMVDDFQPITFDTTDATPLQETDLNNVNLSDQGEPMIVLNDEEVGKKGKKSDKEGKKKVNKNCSPEQIKSGRGVAWMAYILFFLPLIFNGKNAYVRHHANEGLELNIIDIIGVGLYLAYKFVKVTNYWVNFALMIGSIIGIALVAITTITKLFLIIFALVGKEAQTPFFGKSRMIK